MGKGRVHRWVDHSVYLGFWYLAQEVLGVVAFLPSTLSCRLCSLKPWFIVHSSSQKLEIVKRKRCLNHEFLHLFSELFAVIHIVWSIYPPPSLSDYIKNVKKTTVYIRDFPSLFSRLFKSHYTSLSVVCLWVFFLHLNSLQPGTVVSSSFELSTYSVFILVLIVLYWFFFKIIKQQLWESVFVSEEINRISLILHLHLLMKKIWRHFSNINSSLF